MIKTLTASLFDPTASFTGNGSPTVFRGENMVLRGLFGVPFFECFGGNLDLDENYDLTANALTGTIEFLPGNVIITGTGTVFEDELHIGQMILSESGEVFAVSEVVDQTHFKTYRAPTMDGTGESAYRLPQLFEIKNKRGVMLSGNAVQFEKGNIIAVGSGELCINGVPLLGESLHAQKRAQIALYRPATRDYKVLPLGFTDAPPKPAINVVSGGTKGMVSGNKHSFMISYWSATPEGTNGYSDPSPVVKLNAANAKLQLTDTLNRFEFDFTAAIAAKPANATGFVVWGSLAGRKNVTGSGLTATTSSPNETLYENGSWFRAAKIKISDLVGGKAFVEYLDSEVFDEVTGNNDPVPDAEFVSVVEGKPLYISCFGKGTVSKPGGTSPGQYCAVSKFSNPDGVPTEWAASVKNNIIGFFEGVGRWFLMSQTTLDFLVATGLTGSDQQNGSTLELPVATRPYWKTGAANRYSITIIDDTLFGFSGNKIYKSIGNGDENSQKYDFGAPVEDITRKFNSGFVMTCEDAKNNAVCFIYSASHKNDTGYWCSTILTFSLFRNAWLPQIVLSDETRDMVVSGVASINERFEFLAGGRTASGDFETRTYRFDEDNDSTAAMPYYLVWQITDDGAEMNTKEIKSFKPTGKFTAMKIQVHGARPGGQIIVSDMEAGTNSLSGDVAFADSTEVTAYLEQRIRLRNLGKYAVRISGVWDGVGGKDRLDEIALEVGVHGSQI